MLRLVFAAALAVLPASQTASPTDIALTCDASVIGPESYRLTTEAQALNLTRPPQRWWNNYQIGTRLKNVEDANDAAMEIAERARELDGRNLLAHAQLARQYLVAGIDAMRAHEAWSRTLDAGGAVVWLATLFDVDDRAYFVVAFDRQGIRVYRLGQLAGAIRMEFGVPRLPGPDREELWRALGGCLPDDPAPEAVIPWSAVREIESGRFVLWFELDAPVSIRSDRGRQKSLDRIMVSLHSATGDFGFRRGFERRSGPFFMRRAGVGPAAYQERVRGTLVEFFDPDGRIKLPSQRLSGW